MYWLGFLKKKRKLKENKYFLKFMAHRHLSRGIALQSLFEWDFYDGKKDKIDAILARNILEFGEDGAEKDFIVRLTKGVLKKRETLDEIITKAARDWPLLQTPLVDRNVLRIGLFELIFAKKDEVPARVAINEAIELAKSFGGERSGKFINGVLGTIYKEMGEPGKNEEPKRKRKYKKKEDLTSEEKEQLPLKKLVGAVVYNKDSKGNTNLALVHDVFGYWTLSKGHVKSGEEPHAGAVREVKEELSLDVTVEADLGRNEYVASDPETGKVRKQVNYFLAVAADKNQLKLNPSGGLDNARWFGLEEVAGLKIYDDILPFITKAIKLLHART